MCAIFIVRAVQLYYHRATVRAGSSETTEILSPTNVACSMDSNVTCTFGTILTAMNSSGRPWYGQFLFRTY